MIAWSTIKDAFHDLVVTATTIPTDRILWAGEMIGRPSTSPWARWEILSLVNIGQDETAIEDNPTPVAGEEILFKGWGMRELTLELTIFGERPPVAAQTVPFETLTSLTAQLWIPPVCDSLSVAGFGLAEVGNVLNINGQIGETVLEPQASVVLRGFIASNVEFPGTYIETAEVTGIANPPQ